MLVLNISGRKKIILICTVIILLSVFTTSTILQSSAGSVPSITMTASSKFYLELDMLHENTSNFTTHSSVPLSDTTPSADSKYPDMSFSIPQKFYKISQTAYLTFDDGVSPVTVEILDILKEYDIKATFFVIGDGNEDDESIKILKQIVDDGHTIGIHTYSHKYNDIYSSVDSYLDDFYKIYKYIYENTGVKSQIFRFPGGTKNNFNTNTRDAIIEEMLSRGFVFYDWNVSLEDSTPGMSVDSVVQNFSNSFYNQDHIIILAHDDAYANHTARALPTIIEKVRDLGYTFDKLDVSIEPIIQGQN